VNGLTAWLGVVPEPAAVSVPVTVTEVQPGALIVIVAAPVPEVLAATYTGCGRFQLLDDSVIEAPLEIERPLLPEVTATVTGMLAVGDSFSETPNTSVFPCATLKVEGFACRVSPEPQDPVGVGVGVGVGLGDALGDGLGDGEDDGVGVGDGEGEDASVTEQLIDVGAVLVPV